MDWKRLTEGDVAACSHPGGTYFLQVEAGTVVWWAECPRNPSSTLPSPRPPAGTVRCKCRDRRCSRNYWAVIVPADQALAPPRVAA